MLSFIEFSYSCLIYQSRNSQVNLTFLTSISCSNTHLIDLSLLFVSGLGIERPRNFFGGAAVDVCLIMLSGEIPIFEFISYK